MINIDSINKRVIREANYMVNTGETIREMARKYGLSKSTIHKDLNDRLLSLNASLHEQVEKILQYHINIRHIRGGESTRKKYLKQDYINIKHTRKEEQIEDKNQNKIRY